MISILTLEMMEDSEPTKQSVVSITAKFFEPLGVVSPVTILFKILPAALRGKGQLG